MQKKHLLFAVLFFASNMLFAQRPYYNERPEFLKANSVWAFGKNAGIDLNGGSINVFETKVNSSEGSAAVADPNTGELLFYSSGSKCWNRNHELMPNGDNLWGNTGSVTQGVCIVPFVDFPGRYYLFSLTGSRDNDPSPNGSLFYSVIDMSLDNGLGDVVQGQKNIILSKDDLSESMIAIPGNHCDIWLLVHEYQKPVFKAYNISKNGVDTVSVVSNEGKQLEGSFAYALGSLTVSPDRSMIAIGSYFLVTSPGSTGALLAKFDANTGKVSSAMQLTGNQTYGVCFSPDNSKLYLSSGSGTQHWINQYDMSNFDSAAIVSSLSEIASIKHALYVYLKLYDGKIYHPYSNISPHGLSQINLPNLKGVACDYDSVGTVFSSQIRTYISLSNDVVFAQPADTTYQKKIDTIVCPSQNIALTALPGFVDYEWDDGSKDTVRRIHQAGIYWVRQYDGCRVSIDTFIIQFYDFHKPVINVDVLELSTVRTYSTYQWLLNGVAISGATQSTYVVQENGNYQVAVSNGYCIDTSDVYKVTNAETSISDVGFLTGQLKVFPNPATNVVYISSSVDVGVSIYTLEGRLIQTVEKAKEIDLQLYIPGIYFLKIYDMSGRLLKAEKVIKQY